MGNGLSNISIQLDHEAGEEHGTTKKYLNDDKDAKPLTGNVTFNVAKKIKSGRAIFVDVCCSEHRMVKIKGFRDDRNRKTPDRWVFRSEKLWSSRIAYNQFHNQPMEKDDYVLPFSFSAPPELPRSWKQHVHKPYGKTSAIAWSVIVHYGAGREKMQYYEVETNVSREPVYEASEDKIARNMEKYATTFLTGMGVDPATDQAMNPNSSIPSQISIPPNDDPSVSLTYSNLKAHNKQ